MPWQQNKRTGEWREVDADGKPVAPTPSRGTVYAPPADPYKQSAEARAQQDQALQAQRFQFEQEKAARELNKPTATDQQLAADRNTRVGALNNLADQINRVQELGNTGPLASQSPLSAIGDYLPFAENSRFNTAGAQLSQQGLAAFRVPGTGTVSDRDAMMFDRGNLPQAGNMDAANEEILRGIRSRVENEYQSIGLPAPKWTSPLNQPQPDAPASQAAQGSLANAITGNTRTRYERNPDLERAVSLAFRRGASLEELNSITVPAGYGPINAAEYMQAKQAPKGADITFTVGKNIPLSRMEEFSGSTTGGAAMGLGNAGSFGMVQRLAPEAYQDAQDLNPNANLAGEVLGSITGTAGLGKLGTAATSRLGAAGQMLAQGGGRAGNFARGVGTDAVYSGIYGANTGQGAGESALQGALGSLGGRAVGKTLGSALGGLKRAPGADELLAENVPLTVGQQRGGMLKSFEDRLSSTPMVGDLVNARRTEGFEGFQTALQNKAGEPIGARFDGGDWREGLPDQFGQAYDSVTAGVNVPLDAQWPQDVSGIGNIYNRLPPAPRVNFAQAMDNTIGYIDNAGQMSGDTYQNTMRSLKGYKAKASSAAGGFDDDYRGALSSAQQVLKDQMMRGGGDSVVQGLGRADNAYRMGKVIQEAQMKATNGSLTGIPGLPAPSQFNSASMANAKKFGGQRPFGDLIDAAQKVMPSKIGDSGTAGRLAQLALPTALVGGGAGAGYATGGTEGAAATPLALAALLAAGGTKGGQKALGKLLFSRPAALRSTKAQRAVSKLQGLFGAAAIPLAIE